MNPDRNDLSRLEERLGCLFQDQQLLQTALTHKSFTNENPCPGRENNERLEFLGDSVLSLIISQYLYRKFPELTEGDLSKIRANLVNENTLSAVAKEIGLGACLFLGKGEEGTGGRTKHSLLSDALEAVIGGIYLDRGIREVTRVVVTHFRKKIQKAVEQKQPFDYKTTFQEVCQERFGTLPTYTLTRTSGPDHNRVFVMELSVNGEALGIGSGKSKKEAQQQAAFFALEKLRKQQPGAKRRRTEKPGAMGHCK